jgi:hypothetical protein
VAELGFSATDLILAKLTQGPAVMIDRPPPPAAPKSGHRSNRPCHPKAAGQTYCLQKLERATTTVNVPKTLLKCQSLRDQGSLGDALHQQAFSALTASPGARAYYDELRARGSGHHAALRQLGNRLVGILHGCLKTRTLYDEQTAWGHHDNDQQAA